MRSAKVLYYLMMLFVIQFGTSCFAQGLLIYKNDGTSMAINYNILDSILTYNEADSTYVLLEASNSLPLIAAVNQSNDGVTILRHYCNDTDIRTTISPCGVNNLPQISEISYITNSDRNLKPADLYCDGTNTKKSNTDWIGPYQLIASGGEEVTSYDFTGGWHGYDGGGTGSPTARCHNIEIYADNRKITYIDGVIACYSLTVVVTNYIQAMNTKIADGSGKEVLKEIVTYQFENDRLNVSVQGEALEQLRIATYYGMQVPMYGYKVKYVTGDSMIATYDFAEQSTCETKCDAIIAIDRNNDSVTAILYPIGLGNQAFKAQSLPYAFTSTSKAYYFMVNGSPCVMNVGDIFYWKGCYKFQRLN